MVRLTIAKYFTPTGRCIQKSYEKGAGDYSKDIINRFNSGELSNEDSIHFPDSLKYTTKIKSRAVYGGGGIMPDYFVALDTTPLTDYYSKMIRKGTINSFLLNYVDKNRKDFSAKYPVFDKFFKEYEVSDALLDELKEQAKKDKIEPKEGQVMGAEETARLKRQMKALIANDIWKPGEFWQIINTENEIIKKAVEVLKDNAAYEKKLNKNTATKR